MRLEGERGRGLSLAMVFCILWQGNAVSLDSSSNGDGNDGDSEVVLKPSPKPVLKSPAGSKDETHTFLKSKVYWSISLCLCIYITTLLRLLAFGFS